MKILCFSLVIMAATFSMYAQDSVLLKNGKSAGGLIYKMEDGKIFLKTGKDTAIYKADELKTIMFCGTEKDDRNCCGESINYKKRIISKNESTYAKSNNPCGDNKNIEKGTVEFRCNMCGGEGTLKVENENGDKTQMNLFTVTVDKDNPCWLNRQVLIPGNYIWAYSDTNNNATKGKFSIAKGGQKKIILFEKEK